LEKPVAWEKFTESVYERFPPKTTRREMKQQFINLRQGSSTVDEYAAKFLRLSRFASYMVADEEDWANRFQRGLRLDIQKSWAHNNWALTLRSLVLLAAWSR